MGMNGQTPKASRCIRSHLSDSKYYSGSGFSSLVSKATAPYDDVPASETTKQLFSSCSESQSSTESLQLHLLNKTENTNC
ncbi:hypothetical protein CEXT_300171 [Caerostris extrusa]|uniref:Uncharacterized protein n=1 Tax=Caerostris extrusa TaxID=172846 RepID=A0AAV4TUB2_CAEEX|nr:hypothetical protein CEXT_300171 [Caerostris extrusa]